MPSMIQEMLSPSTTALNINLPNGLFWWTAVWCVRFLESLSRTPRYLDYRTGMSLTVNLVGGIRIMPTVVECWTFTGIFVNQYLRDRRPRV